MPFCTLGGERRIPEIGAVWRTVLGKFFQPRAAAQFFSRARLGWAKAARGWGQRQPRSFQITLPRSFQISLQC